MPPKPVYAIVAILDRCDAKCIMCNIWREHRRDELRARTVDGRRRTKTCEADPAGQATRKRGRRGSGR